jgi:hypothetical protein
VVPIAGGDLGPERPAGDTIARPWHKRAGLMSTADEKRTQRRIPADIWIEVQSQGELYFQRASNLSVGGAYFTQTFPLPVGTKVQLRFSLPSDPHQIGCRGEIVNAKDLGMGVQFVELSEADHARIEQLIDRHLGD